MRKKTKIFFKCKSQYLYNCYNNIKLFVRNKLKSSFEIFSIKIRAAPIKIRWVPHWHALIGWISICWIILLHVVIGVFFKCWCQKCQTIAIDFPTEAIDSDIIIMASLLWCIDSCNTFTISSLWLSSLLSYRLKTLGYIDWLLNFSSAFSFCCLRALLPYTPFWALIYFSLERFQFFLLGFLIQLFLANQETLYFHYPLQL